MNNFIIISIAILLAIMLSAKKEKFENTDGILDKIMNSYSRLETKFDTIYDGDTIKFHSKLNAPNAYINALAADNFTALNQVTANNKITTPQVNIADTTLDKEYLQRLNSITKFGGFAVDGGGSTYLLFEGFHTLENQTKWGWWSEDKWNLLYIFKGWNIKVYWDRDESNLMMEDTNTGEDAKLVNLNDDAASAYRLTFVGY